MTTFDVNYMSPWDNENKPLQYTIGIIDSPRNIKWEYENRNYFFERTLNNIFFNIYVSQDVIIVLYSDKISISPHPNNLIMYNLRQEVIGIIPPPKLVTTKSDLPITGIDNIIDIDGKQYLQVCINYGDVKAVLETHYFNIQKREYHPDKVEILHFGNYR